MSAFSDSDLSPDQKIFYTITEFIRERVNNVNHEFVGIHHRIQKVEVEELLRRAVTTRESNSAIICGPPGCGKTSMVKNILKELSQENVINEKTAIIVELSGLVHTDDRLALLGIAAQLNLSQEFESRGSRSFQENLCFLLESVKQQEKEQPCIIFILDDIQLFCKHKNQILLYNLFDTAQSAKAPICVLGMTYCVDIMDLMEKRVLSRFTHRIIYMNEPPNIESRITFLKEIMIVDAEQLPEVDEVYIYLWNTKLEELLEDKEVIDLLQQHMDCYPSLTKFRNDMFCLISSVTINKPLLDVVNFKKVFSLTDYKLMILKGLPLLEMALIIAIKHQTVNYEREPFNFEMIYSQYIKFTARHSTNLITERSTLFKAFERVQDMEVILPLKKLIGVSNQKTPAEYQLFQFDLTTDQVNEAVKLNKNLTTELRKWSDNEID